MNSIEQLFQGSSRDERKEAELARYLLHTTSLRKLPSSCPATTYPIDSEGYAYAFNLEIEGIQLLQTFKQLGFVVVRSVVSEESCQALVARSKVIVAGHNRYASTFSGLSASTLPKDGNGTPILSRGFLEIYHDNAWASIRQSPGLYQLWVLLWGQLDIWTTFDRIGFRPAGQSIDPLPLHVDQNPWLDPGFATIQGILALEDCPIERGTTVLVPGSKQCFHQWKPLAQNHPGKHYVEVGDYRGRLEVALNPQQIPLKRGDILVWDSRTLHGATANLDRTSDRWVALVASGKARCNDRQLVRARQHSLKTCEVWNERAAYMHASKSPRYSAPYLLNQLRNPEQLTLLGELLYGVRSWEDFL
jgi:hypothetical protein